MEHAASPSLFSLGLTSDASSEGSPFRWGLISSIVLHALVIAIAMLVRVQTDDEQPFRTIDVALISLPTMSTSTAKPAPATPKKSAAVQPPKKVAAPPPAKPTAPPVESTLPPLPTKTASERLSESLGGAINSIVVPQKREATISGTPSGPNLQPSEDQAPLLGNLQLPSPPPTIARPKRLQPAEPLNVPSSTPSRPTPVQKKALQPLKSRPLPTTPPPAEPRPEVKPAPTIPSLSEVTPFTKPEQTTKPPKTPNNSKIEESLKRNIQDIQTPSSTPKVPKVSRKKPTTQPESTSSTPHISAPQLAEIPQTQRPIAQEPAQPKMTDTVKKLMEGLKSTTRMPETKKIPLEQTNPSQVTTPTVKPPSSQSSSSAIDQQIAKLSIPEVTPVESIKQRLQLLEVPTTESSGGSTVKPSPGKNRYLAMVEDRIDRQWVAPPLLTSSPIVVLNFHISRSGEISRIQISESSGHAHYDSSALRAVQSVNPLPPFPADISDSFFEVKYRFIKD